MTETKVQALIEELKNELAKSPKADSELLDIVDKLDAHMEKMTDNTVENTEDLNDTLLLIEARLRCEHPTATRITEEIIGLIGNMGI